MEARAIASYVRVSPRKARLVVDLIRGKSVDEARAILKFSPRAAAEVVEKVLNSAVANAEHNLHVKADDARSSSDASSTRARRSSASSRVPWAARSASTSARATSPSIVKQREEA